MTSRPLLAPAPALVLILALGTLTAPAQHDLRDIPDPDPIQQAAAFNLPAGMEINLFAVDPMIAKPIQMNFDSQGRLWVVTSKIYPHIIPGADENDRVLILEDTNGDGTADQRTVFADDLHIPTAVMPADGGAYVANSHEILFLKDTDGDGQADERRVVLSGFGTEDTHHLVHTFEQGPDGMLYFMQSKYIHSHVETPYGIRRLMGGGIWQLRPETARAEILSQGLINPWGFVFDDYGQTFATDGAGGQGINYIFPRSVFTSTPGATRTLRGLNSGQPKLCGLEILSGAHVPENWQGVMVAPDFRGHRINAYRLTPKGSSYTSTRIDDFLSSTHRAFRPVDVKMGPDGAIYIADWYNPIIQHGEVDFRDERRDQTRGRIWRVTFQGQPLLARQDFRKASDESLLSHTLSPERQHREMARRELRNRRSPELITKLKTWTKDLTEDSQKLEALWNHQALNLTESDLLDSLTASKDPRYRAAALRVLSERHREVPHADEILRRAIVDENAQVRLWAITCLAQRPSPESVPLALQVLAQPMDKTLDFALWSIVREHESSWVPPFEAGQPVFGGQISHLLFAIKALAKPLPLGPLFAEIEANTLTVAQRKDAFAAISQVGSPKDLSRLMTMVERNPQILNHLITAMEIRKLAPADDQEQIIPLLKGPHFQKAARLAGLWQLAPARDALLTLLHSEPTKRRAAAEGLRLLGDAETIALFEKLSRDPTDPVLQTIATKELAYLSPERAATAAVEILSQNSNPQDSDELIERFLSNPQASTALANALEGKTLPPAVSNLGLQRAGTSGNPPQDLIKAFRNAGNLQPMSQQLTQDEMARLVEAVHTNGDPHHGERIYRRTSLGCVACHAIGGVGSPIGPDLLSIGSSAPVDYLITSLLEPNDKIKEGYHTTLVTETNGNTHTGGLVSDGDDQVILRDFTGQEKAISKADIKTITISPISMMPAGLTAGLGEAEFVDLVRFLSELGKEGDFKVSPRPFIRNWKVLQPHPRTADLIRHYGPSVLAEEFDGYQWQDYVSKVNGELDPRELPKLAEGRSKRWSVARFSIEASLEKAPILTINDTQSIHLFDNGKEIKLPRSGPAQVPISLGEKPNRLTIAINSEQRTKPLLVEVLPQ